MTLKPQQAWRLPLRTVRSLHSTLEAGLEILGDFVGHNGTIFGFSTEMFYLPEHDATVLVSVNRLDEDDHSQSTDTFLRVTSILFPDNSPWAPSAD